MLNRYLIIGLFVLIFLIIPIALTIINVRFLFVPYERLSEDKRLKRSILYTVTVIFGFAYTAFYEYEFAGVTNLEYYEVLEIDTTQFDTMYHTVLSREFGGWFWLLFFLSSFCMCLLHFTLEIKKPPLVSALLIGGTAVCTVLAVVYSIQIANILFPFPLMYIFCLVGISVRGLLDEAEIEAKRISDNANTAAAGLNQYIFKLFSSKNGFAVLVFAAMLPFAALALIYIIIKGQQPDALVKAFTMTADWTFSKQIPPPPEYYDGHYLCTVAAGGHRKLVKPTRMGVRRGERIIVNRQLCVANAFEDLIKEKTPRFHKAVRSFYDKHGYPVSRHITTPLRADIVYIAMKPLEWIFVLVLYLFDLNPENRIAVQYTK